MGMQKILFVAAMIAFNLPAIAAEKLQPLDDASLVTKAALGKQMRLVFSGEAKAKYFPKAEYDGFSASEINGTQFCFYGNADGPSVDDPKFKDIVRAEKVDLCVKRSEVSAKYDFQNVSGASPQPFFQSDVSNCKWVWKTGKGIGVWTENCKFDTDAWSVTYNEADDSFAQGISSQDQYTVLRQYRKKPTESPDVLLPALKAAKLIPNDDECKFEISKDEVKAPHFKIYDIVPLGKRKAAYDAVPENDLPDPPCGEVGLAVDYEAYWMIDDRHPDRVLFVNLGQDGSMFDPYSILLF
jgi:hypothetical protein